MGRISSKIKFILSERQHLMGKNRIGMLHVREIPGHVVKGEDPDKVQ